MTALLLFFGGYIIPAIFQVYKHLQIGMQLLTAFLHVLFHIMFCSRLQTAV